MWRRIWRFIVILVKTSLLMGVLTLFGPRLITALHTISRVFTIKTVPPARAALVFGAGLWRDGSPTPVLRDRVSTAADLFFSGKVEKLLLSGDNRFEYYNEPGAMKQYALSLGVPEEAIVLDYAGRRTYDTCYRAKAIFGLDDAILVTQSFHLPRALYTCNALGLRSSGVPADRRNYKRLSLLFWNLRELPATLTALWDIHIARPLPVLGDPEPIFPSLTQ